MFHLPEIQISTLLPTQIKDSLKLEYRYLKCVCRDLQGQAPLFHKIQVWHLQVCHWKETFQKGRGSSTNHYGLIPALKSTLATGSPAEPCHSCSEKPGSLAQTLQPERKETVSLKHSLLKAADLQVRPPQRVRGDKKQPAQIRKFSFAGPASAPESMMQTVTLALTTTNPTAVSHIQHLGSQGSSALPSCPLVATSQIWCPAYRLTSLPYQGMALTQEL